MDSAALGRFVLVLRASPNEPRPTHSGQRALPGMCRRNCRRALFALVKADTVRAQADVKTANFVIPLNYTFSPEFSWRSTAIPAHFVMPLEQSNAGVPIRFPDTQLPIRRDLSNFDVETGKLTLRPGAGPDATPR